MRRLALLLALTACSEVPEPGAIAPEPRPQAWPEIVPLGPLLEEVRAAAPAGETDPETDALLTRAEALRRAAR